MDNENTVAIDSDADKVEIKEEKIFTAIYNVIVDGETD